MAESDALLHPKQSTAFRFYLPVYKNDGTLITASWTGVVLTVSVDSAAIVTNVGTVTQIASLGMGSIDFTSGQIGTNKNISGTLVVSNSGALPTPFSISIAAPGEIDVDTTYWNGTAVATSDTAGYPKVTVKDGTGTGEIDTASGRVQLSEAQIDQIVDEILDELLSGHVIAGSVGAGISTAGSAGDPLENQASGYASGTAGAKIALIGTMNGTINVPSTPSGDVLYIKQGVSYTDYALTYNCRLLTAFDETTDPVKLIIQMPYNGGAQEQFTRTIDVANINETASYIVVNPYSVLTSARTKLMPLGDFDAQIVAFTGAGDTEANIIMEFRVNVSEPGFNYSATDS